MDVLLFQYTPHGGVLVAVEKNNSSTQIKMTAGMTERKTDETTEMMGWVPDELRHRETENRDHVEK